MTKSAKRSIIISAVLAIIMCVSLFAGATLAIFTSDSKVNIAVTAGTVEVVATLDEPVLSHKEADSSAEGGYKEVTGTFYAGTATLDENNQMLTVSNMVSMDKISFNIAIQNNSTVAVKYRTVIMCEEDNGLFEALTVSIGDNSFDGRTAITNYQELAVGADVASVPVTIEIGADKGANGEYNAKSCTVSYKVEAVQGNAATEDVAANEYQLYNATDLKWLQKHASEIAAYSTVKLMNDIDLDGADLSPIYMDSITFDGNKKTISDFTTEGTFNVGLFGSAQSCTIENLTVTGATVTGITHVGAIVGHGVCTTIKDCTVKNSQITAVNKDDNGDKPGAIVGYLSAEYDASVTGCSVEGCTVKGYRDVGGLVGMANGAQKTSDDGHGWVVTGNKVKSTILINDRSCITRTIAEDGYNIGEVIGRYSGTVDSSNTATDVTIRIEYGDGLVWNPTAQQYEITSVNGLKAFRDKINLGKDKNGNDVTGLKLFNSVSEMNTVVLKTDIDLKNELWTPINLSPVIYDNGGFTFNGEGHTISNINVVSSNGKAAGLFGYCYTTGSAYTSTDNDGLPGLRIKNLKINNASVEKTMTATADGGQYGAAALIGQATSVYLENVHATGKITVTSDGAYDIGISTLTGYTGGRVVAKDCSVVATGDSVIDAESNGEHVGGIFGVVALEGVGNIYNCSVSGITVKGDHCVGGLVGYINGDSVNNDTSEGGTISISKCTVKNVTVSGRGGVAALVGQWKTEPDYVGSENSTTESVTVNNSKAWPGN